MANEDIFDLLEDDFEGQDGFINFASRAPMPKDNSFYNSIKDYGKTALKGTIEGVSRFGQMMGGLQTFEPQGQQLEKQTEILDELLPTDEGYGQKSLRRGLRMAPTALSFPGGGTAQTATRSMLAGFSGQAAKDLGLPEWAQSAAELTMFIGPDVMKKLLEKGSNADIIKFGRDMGLTDKQITPLIQSEFKQKWLSKISPKRGQIQKSLSETKSGLEKVYSSIQNSQEAKNLISNNQQNILGNKFNKLLRDMPSDVRNKIMDDLKDLASKPISGESLINFYSDINHNLGPKSKQLSLLKEPIKEAIKSISPELASDFDMINKMYSKYFPISQKLKPNLTSDIISAAESIGLLGSVALGNYSGIVTFLSEKAGKEVAKQMLINPRFQQLSKKMIVAINENKFNLLKKIKEDFSDLISETSKEASYEIDKISDEALMKFFNHQKEDEQEA